MAFVDNGAGKLNVGCRNIVSAIGYVSNQILDTLISCDSHFLQTFEQMG
jgi:hypothetical protein